MHVWVDDLSRVELHSVGLSALHGETDRRRHNIHFQIRRSAIPYSGGNAHGICMEMGSGSPLPPFDDCNDLGRPEFYRRGGNANAVCPLHRIRGRKREQH
jgi:hypothetical protein